MKHVDSVVGMIYSYTRTNTSLQTLMALLKYCLSNCVAQSVRPKSKALNSPKSSQVLYNIITYIQQFYIK